MICDAINTTHIYIINHCTFLGMVDDQRLNSDSGIIFCGGNQLFSILLMFFDQLFGYHKKHPETHPDFQQAAQWFSQHQPT